MIVEATYLSLEDIKQSSSDENKLKRPAPFKKSLLLGELVPPEAEADFFFSLSPQMLHREQRGYQKPYPH